MKKISDHLLPLFKGKSAKQILNIINRSRIKSYTNKEKENTELRIRELLEKKDLFNHT